ncbi:MAG: efflux RND transporter periplasmic adaptor subunit [Wenzhouxiangellaceae bacterium]|nr:efflux RND transporter periplasmic adaptor subunit [Wenzhouxiangellaceae bacterium]
MKRIVVTIAVLAVLTIAAVFLRGVWRSGPNPKPDSPGRAAQATTVTLTGAVPDMQITRVENVGTAEAIRSVQLFPPSAGEVVAVNFEAGDHVEAGQTLLQLDARDERLALELAEVQLADAERTLSRYTRAGERAAFTQTQLDQAKIAVEEARIARDRAKVALDDRSLEAPFDGVIGLTDLDPGDRVTTTTPVATLDDTEALLVRFEVPEAFLGQLSLGDTVRLAPWNSREPPVEARLVDIDTRVDPATRTFSVRARLDNAQERWRPGMGFRVTLELRGPEYVRVPELALQWGGDGAYVWVVDPAGRAHRTPVTLIQRDQGSVLLGGDLSPGDRVVLEGVQKMAEGRLVEVVDPASLETRDAVQATVRKAR